MSLSWSVVIALILGSGAPLSAADGGPLDGEWLIFNTSAIQSDALQLALDDAGSVNSDRLSVSGNRWILSRAGGTPRRELVARIAGTPTSGTVELTDGDTGKNHSGRFLLTGDKLDLYLVPGKLVPDVLCTKPEGPGSVYATLEYLGERSNLSTKDCIESRSNPIGFNSPRATFNTLLSAVENEDIELIQRCFRRPPDTEDAKQLLAMARGHLKHSCLIRTKQKKEYLYFWYRIPDPNDAGKTREDRGRMIQEEDRWLIHKL